MNQAPASSDGTLIDQFRQALRACEDLYRRGAVECIERHPELAKPSQDAFFARMLELHRGLLVKVFVTLAQADWRFSPAEYALAGELVEHLWNRTLEANQLKPALQHLVENSSKLTWDSLLRPFQLYRPLQSCWAELEAVVVRIASLVAKIDGDIGPAEVRQLDGIRHELQRCLRPLPLADDAPDRRIVGGQAVAALKTNEDHAPATGTPASSTRTPEKPREVQLAEALEELEALIGLAPIKRDVQELTRFLQMQQERARHGLPETKIGLHMVFEGNPGTGKTTVARIVGRIFGAMGILDRGHLVETDRSGLVAEFAGQTGPKTNKIVDEALDGVLFIDEAYSLVAERGDDPFGAEAVQTLLKRMEDDRDRLVVILAGYPTPIDRMLRSNPGLSSRFNRRLQFPDYTAAELGAIMQSMCGRDVYQLPAKTRIRLLAGFQYLLEARDEHFGNGRLVRNVFEQALRRMATRIVGATPLTRELLTMLEPTDIVMRGIQDNEWSEVEALARRIDVTCPYCGHVHRTRGRVLGRQVKCRGCHQPFAADWGIPISSDK